MRSVRENAIFLAARRHGWTTCLLTGTLKKTTPVTRTRIAFGQENEVMGYVPMSWRNLALAAVVC